MASKKESKKDKSVIVPQRDKIKESLSIFHRDDLTNNQRNLIELINHKETKIVFINGVAGTSKTYIAVLCALMLLDSKRVSDLIYFRTIVESAGKSLGSLPGELEEKFSPFMGPLLDKLEELLPRQEAEKLIKEKRVQALPINYLRGASFNAKFLLADEAQNFTFEELTTLVTRFGKFSKMVIVGDTRQADIGAKSGFKKMFDIFDDESSKQNGIHTFSFTEDDIVRSELLKFIVRKIESGKQ